MDIILFTPRVWDSTWGQEKNLVAELKKYHQITIIDVIDYGLRYATELQGKQYPVPKGVKIIKRQTKMPAGIVFGIYTELRNVWDFWRAGGRKVDIVITYFTAGVILTVCLAKCLRKKVLLIYADDYAEFFRSKSSPVAWFTEHIGTPLVAKLSDAVVTTAHKLKEDLIRFNAEITVIPNGVNVQKLKTYYDNLSEQKLKENFPRPFTVGFVGGFGTWIDFDMVLTIAEALPDVQFKLIGSGDQFDEVSERARELENVWVPGILPYEQAMTELATMDVCLIPFKVNRITDRVSPIKLFEYWAMKKPVISTRFYEVCKVAEGKVCFIDTAEDLKNTILQLQEHGEQREEMAEKGFQEVGLYDWSKLGKRYLDILQHL